MLHFRASQKYPASWASLGSISQVLELSAYPPLPLLLIAWKNLGRVSRQLKLDCTSNPSKAISPLSMGKQKQVYNSSVLTSCPFYREGTGGNSASILTHRDFYYIYILSGTLPKSRNIIAPITAFILSDNHLLRNWYLLSPH